MPSPTDTNPIIEAIKFIGGLAGLFAFGWKIFEFTKSYLKIKVQATYSNDIISVLTEVENSSFIAKDIVNAILIISPEDDNLIQVGKKIKEALDDKHYSIRTTDNFINFKPTQTTYIEKKIAIVPLPFYYSENIDIADEKLTYRCSLNKDKFEKGSYSVRFYLFHHKRLLRTTQDLFIIK
jgi:hypothetical protein